MANGGGLGSAYGPYGHPLRVGTPTWPKKGRDPLWPSPTYGEGAYMAKEGEVGSLLTPLAKGRGAYMAKEGGKGALRPPLANPYGRGGPLRPMAKESVGLPFGHPLPSAYGRGWLPLAIGAKEGGGGALLTLCPKERLAIPMAIPCGRAALRPKGEGGGSLPTAPRGGFWPSHGQRRVPSDGGGGFSRA
jgi:hypothetical protein